MRRHLKEQEPELSNSSFKQELSEDSKMNSKYIWRKYCTDGSPYGIDPQDFEAADDYEEMIQQIRERKN